MTVDARFVLSPNLQDLFVSKYNGLPLVNGYVYFWDDINRTVPKTVYRQSGSAPDYTYVALPNPVRLGPAGSYVDNSGNDVNVYLFPYQGTPDNSDNSVRLYYISVFNSGMQAEFTRSGWPPNLSASADSLVLDDFNNQIINGSFLYNIGTTSNPIDSTTTVLAPSVNQGLIQPDIYLFKNDTSGLDTVTFNQFAPGIEPITGLDTPIYYLHYSCPNIPISETFKQIMFPLGANVNTLNGQTVTVSFWATSSLGNELILGIYQDFGTGGTPSALNRLEKETFDLTNSWVEYSFVFVIPTTAGKELGTNGDSFVAMFLGLEFGQINITDITNVQMLIGNQSNPSYIYQSPQEVASQVFTPRTGEHKLSLGIPGPNWLYMNDGTIGSESSNATTRAYVDSFILYSLIWNTVTSITPQFAPIYTSAGVLTTVGVSASADFAANKQISLTKALGRLLSGANPAPSPTFSEVYTADSSTDKILVADTTKYEVGEAVTVSVSGGALAAPLVAGVLYYIIISDATHLQLATTPDNAFAGTAINLTTNGTGTQTITSNNFGTPIYFSQFTADAATDLITVADTSSLFVGTQVTFSPVNAGILPAPLIDGIVYYAIPINNVSFKIAINLSFAHAGVAVNITTNGTSPNQVKTVNQSTVSGEFLGQENHSLTSSELAAHIHNITEFDVSAGASSAHGVSSGYSSPDFNTSAVGQNKPFNIIQPTTYLNIYIKL